MQPYVIKQGDYLAKLAHQFDFDADTVWNDDKNAQLKQLRPDPNILFPSDVLYVPDPAEAPAASLTQGTTNAFVSSAPTVAVTLKFSDAALASQPLSVVELPALTGLTTDASGTATVTIPVTLETFTVAFPGPKETFAFMVGNLDPSGTLSGTYQRLQSLGYVDADATFDPSNLDLIRAALRDFKANTNPPSGDAPAPASSPPSSASPPSSPASAPGAPSSAPASGAAPPASSPAQDSAPASAPADNAGLSDDGTLDDATSKLLVQAHGC